MFVWLIWGLEALILLGGSAFGGFGAAKEPYAEASGEWLEEGEKFMFVSPAADVLQQVIGAQDVDSLLAIHANPGEGDRAAILFEPWRVPGNPVPAYVSVSLRQSEVDDDGEVKFDDTRLHTRVVLTPEQGARLNELSKLGVGVADDDEATAQAMAAASAPAGTPAPDAAPMVPPGADQSTGEDEQPRA